jgi:hypothetical protein
MSVRSPGTLGVLSALAFAAVLTSCSSGGTYNGAQDRGFKNESAGISLAVPQGWHATARRFTGLLDPRERVVLTSFLVDGDGRSQGCSPDPVLRQLPRSGVAAFLLEYMDVAARRNVDPRPHRFQLRPPAFGGFECFWPPGGTDAYLFNFGDSGRAFQLLVAVGRDATAETLRAAAEALDSIRIEPCDRPLPSETKPKCRRPLPA